MKRILGIYLGALVLVLAGPAVAHAQFGFGAGIAAVGDNISQAGGSLGDLLSADSLTYGDVSKGVGFYLTGRIKYGLGAVRLIGDLSYAFFPSSQVTLVDYSVDQQNQAGTATFDVGTTLIPINAGLEAVLPLPVVRPYLGAEFSYTLVSRTYTIARADANSQFAADVANKPAGENEAGLAFGAGAEIAVGPVALDLGARYNLANLFTKENNEKQMSYLQIGATLYFGDLMHKD
jgi:hypothetical protein